MDTLFSLMRAAGHEPLTATRGINPMPSLSNWSGPGDIQQWPSLADMGYYGAIGEYSALNYAAVYASVRILSLIDAALPVHIYRDLPRGGRDKVTDDYRYRLLHDRPNPEMSASLFRCYMRQNSSLWGNSYALIDWGRSNRADAIWPLRPDWMTVYRTKSGKKVYHYEPHDESNLRAGYYDPDEVLHFRGLGDDLLGYSPIRLARQGIELGMAATSFGAAFFRNGARPSGILEVQ